MHDTGSNAVLVPTGHDFHAVLTDADGSVLDEVHEPHTEKGNSAGHQANESICTLDYSIAFDHSRHVS
jgi:hypothetical protein